VKERILVIKLSALGDFVQAFGPFQAIRDHHPDAHITLLTTKPFVELAHATGWFDDVQIDTRPKLHKLGEILKLRRFLLSGHFDRIYDLHTSGRTKKYFHLMWPHKPEWSGTASGCSHYHNNPERDNIHTLDRHREQLAIAGITDIPNPDVSWLDQHAYPFSPMDRFVLLIPGGAPHRPDKRWPAKNYAELARKLDQQGIIPVIIGTKSEKAEAEEILKACPTAQNLVGRTSIFDLATLTFKATAAVGNDTGPMHLAAIAGCPSLVLYSNASDPKLCGQRGRKVDILRAIKLDQLQPEIVYQKLLELVNEQ